jgi:predicted HTH transcriptional regulator
MNDRTQTTDNAPIPGAQLTHLDLARVQQHIIAAQERGRYAGSSDSIEYLAQQQCIIDVDDALVPTLAGILAFAGDPERWLPGTSGIDLAQFSGSDPRSTTLSFFEQIRGPIFTAIERTVELLWARSEHDYRVDGVQRVEEHAYPRVVLRELTVNALCHRDWALAGSRIRIQMFPQAIEWTSPGSLPEGVTIANMLDMQNSRNPILSALLFQAGYIEGFGLGMNTVYATLRETQSEPPYLDNSAHAFTIRVKARPLRPANAATVNIEDRRLTTICTLLQQRGPLTAVDLAAMLNVSRRTLLRDLTDLIAQGKVRSIGATRNLHYVHVAEDNSRHDS